MEGNELGIMLGGRKIPVRYRDGSTGLALVRELAVRDLIEYHEVIDDEEKCVDLYAGPGMAEKLTRESFVEVLKAGEELNLPFFAGWLQRKIERGAKLSAHIGDGIAGQTLVKKAAELAEALASASSQQNSAS